MGRRGRPPHPDILTPREWEVLALLRQGLTNEAIAARLGVTHAAAKFHVSQILAKLGVATREEAAAWEPAPTEAELLPRSRGFPASAAATLARWLRPVTLGKAALITAAVATLAGLGLLAWGVLRDSGDEPVVAALPTGTEAASSADATPFMAGTDIWLVNADGSDLGKLTSLGKPIMAGYNIAPAWSPDGTRIAFFAGSGSSYAETGHLYVMDTDGTDVTELAPASFDYTRKSWCESDRSPVWSPDGTRVAYQANNQIHVINPATGEIFGNFPTYSFDPAWSPDSTAVAYSTGSFDCWISEYSLHGDLPRFATVMGQDVAWSPDGKHLAYVDAGRIMVADPDGQNGRQVAQVDQGQDALEPYNLQWSPDSTKVSYMFHEPDIYTNWIYIVDITAQSPTIRLGNPDHRLYDWSPDGTRIAYMVQEDDSCHYPLTIYVANADGTGTPRKIARGEGPAWSPDGSRIAFIQTTLPGACPTPVVEAD